MLKMSSHTEINASGNSRQMSSAPHWWCSWCQGAMNRIRLAKSRNTSKRQKSRRSLSNVKRLIFHSLLILLNPFQRKSLWNYWNIWIKTTPTSTTTQASRRCHNQSEAGVEHKFLSFLPFLLFQKLV